MSSSSLQLSYILSSSTVKMFFDQISDTEKEVARIAWNYLLTFLSQNWGRAILFLIVLLVVSFVVALSGRWSMFGSVLYHYLHLGALFVVGLIWGPEIFVNIFFDLINLVIYLYSFKLVGYIIDRLGLRKRSIHLGRYRRAGHYT